MRKTINPQKNPSPGKLLVRNHAGRFIRFGGIGAANAFVDLGLFVFFVSTLSWQPILGNISSYMIAVANSYVLNRYFTFRRDRPTRGFFAGMLRFFGVGLVGLAISTASLWAFLFVLAPVLAKIGSILVTLIWNYSASWLLVFKNRGAE